jgi:hypothetical protein
MYFLFAVWIWGAVFEITLLYDKRVCAMFIE